MRLKPFWTITILAVTLVLAAGLPSPAHGRSAMITFQVHTPEYTPEDARVYISGNLIALGPWDPGKVELGKVGDHLYAITLVLPLGTELKYKFTRGSWEVVEKGSRSGLAVQHLRRQSLDSVPSLLIGDAGIVPQSCFQIGVA